jgi:hypothetical protein
MLTELGHSPGDMDMTVLMQEPDSAIVNSAIG